MTRVRALFAVLAVMALVAVGLFAVQVPSMVRADEPLDEAIVAPADDVAEDVAGDLVEQPADGALDEAQAEQQEAVTTTGAEAEESVIPAESAEPVEATIEEPAPFEPETAMIEPEPASYDELADVQSEDVPVAVPVETPVPDYPADTVEDVSLEGYGFTVVDPLTGTKYSISAASGQSFADAITQYFSVNGWPNDPHHILSYFNFQEKYANKAAWEADLNGLFNEASDDVTIYLHWVEIIDTVTLDVVKPKKDQSASVKPEVKVPAGAHYKVIDAYWTDEDTAPYTPLAGTIEACTPHFAYVSLEPDWDYAFDVTNGGPTVESNTANRIHVKNWSCEGSGDERVLLYCDFDHALVRHAAKEATATVPGNKEYWECKDCGDWFWDKDATSPIVGKTEIIVDKWLFEDCPPDAWFMVEGGTVNGWVGYVVSHGLMTGYRDGDGVYRRFGPNDSITRGQVVTILHRWGNPGSKDTIDPAQYDKTSLFSDVPAKVYYTAAINEAYNTGIVTGYGDTGLFKPDQDITREELATIIWRYAAKIKGPGPEGAAFMKGDPAKFNTMADKDQVSDFAYDAMVWCTSKGILGGTGYLRPQDTTTRAEAAKMLTVLLRDIL